MAVLQHYYTSYVNRETGSAGFQVKAMSPGIAGDTQSTIERLISYRIPTRLDEYATASHPVALRYFYRTPQEAILLCSQSNGTDENGRPGNFFAHSLVTEPDIFTSMPPILYWRSRFWRTKDPGTRAVIEPIQSIEEIETTLDIEGVWDFLAQGNRIEQFYKLMCAVVHCNSTQRRIVIIDDTDNVAQWIAALTIMLPPDYRPLLSFATYHHDPYQSQFIVTGTTSDSSFRASPDEYMSYFILNAETGRISEVEDSPYASEAKQAARSYNVYESRLLSLITDYMPRFPHPTRIDELLDSLALYAGMLEPNHAFSLSAKELEAVNAVITTFEQMRIFTQEDLNELRQVGGLLQEASMSQGGEEVYAAYRRSVALHKKHKIPTDQKALREIKFITQHLVSDSDTSSSLERLENMRQTYGEDLLIDIVNSDDYLRWLSKLAGTINTAQLAQIWQYPGIYLNPGPRSQPFAIASLSILGARWNDKQDRKVVRRAVEVMIHAMAGQEKAWLELIVANSSELPERILQRFYCWLVSPLPLDERLPYRAIAQRFEPRIDEAEIQHDLDKVEPQQKMMVLEEWMAHARRQRLPSLNTLLIKGITNLMMDTERRQPEQEPQMAAKILMNQALMPIPPESENKLVSTALSRVSLSSFDDLALAMCKKYRTRQGISEDTRTVMDGLQAMKSGELDEGLARRLQARFVNMRQEDFAAETKSFVSAFLQVCTATNSHQQMVNTFFSWDDPDSFWQAYWHTFKELLTFGDPATAMQAMKLLSFWFLSKPDTFTSSYLSQYFFMDLSQQFDAAGKARGFQESARVINAKAGKEQWGWYPLVEDYFTGRKNALQWMGQNLAAPFQKRRQDSEEGRKLAAREQQERAELDEQIARLFSKKPRDQHNRLLAEVYDWQKHEVFWSIYWTYFKSLCATADNAQQALDIFAFWFDDSFTVLQRKIFIPQQFFLELRDALAEAQKERGFREFARNISYIGRDRSKSGSYPWFGLVKTYFEEQEKRFGLFRR